VAFDPRRNGVDDLLLDFQKTVIGRGAAFLAAAGASTSILRKTPDRGLILSTSSAEAEAAARTAEQSEKTSILK
jgi:hypothetical protein